MEAREEAKYCEYVPFMFAFTVLIINWILAMLNFNMDRLAGCFLCAFFVKTNGLWSLFSDQKQNEQPKNLEEDTRHDPYTFIPTSTVIKEMRVTKVQVSN